MCGVPAAVVALVPLVHLVVRALDSGAPAFLAVLGRPRTLDLLDLLVRSVALAGAVTVACVVIGVLGAWLVVRTDLPGRRAAGVLLVLPLAVPSYVAGFIWISEAPRLAGFWGAFGVLVSVSFPYVFLPVAAALRAADGGLEEGGAFARARALCDRPRPARRDSRSRARSRAPDHAMNPSPVFRSAAFTAAVLPSEGTRR